MPSKENQRESVTFTRPTHVSGAFVEQGESYEVYPFQRRHMVEAGHVEGGYEQIASDGEQEAGALNVLKRADERDDIDVWTVEKAHREGYGYGDPSDAEQQEEQEQPASSGASSGARKGRASASSDNASV
jgi:hypothetical protein